MTSYGQYNRNQVTSDEAADALEQSIFDSDHLYQKYRDELSPLLQEAELRLDEMGLKKFTKIENVIGKHVSRWYQLNKSLCEMSLNFRTHYNHMNVKLDSLKVEIDERDKIIRTQRKDFESDKQQYENQLKVLESALADSIPRNKSSVLDKYNNNNTEQYQLTQLQKDLNISQQSYEKLKIENKRLSENLKILKSSSDDFQQNLMNLNNEISKKEDEILKLRWLTQDLAAERNGLEQKIQKHTNDPNFTSVTPQRQMQYDVDFSKYIDEDQDELSDDAAENGLLSLEMSDDADINPQVAKKLAEALEAVKKVTQFANERDSQARQLESDKVNHGDHSRPSIPKTNGATYSNQPSVNELYSNFNQMKKLQESSPSEAHTLISQMGGFNALSKYITNGDDHYSAMLRRVEEEINNGTKCIELINKFISSITEDEKRSHSKTEIKELNKNSNILISILNNILTELSTAADYMHGDHKKVELLHHQMKELELTMPYIESEQLAILNTLPSFLKQELNKIRKPNRIRNGSQENLLTENDEKQRQMNFDNSLSRVELLNIQIKEKTDVIKNSLRNNLEASQTDPKAFASYLQQIDIACDQISEYTLSLDDEFHFAREYIHPSQATLINIVNQYNNLQIECEQLNKILSIKQGEINALQEIQNTKPKTHTITSSDNKPPQHPIGMVPKTHTHKDESFQFDDIEKDFENFEKYANVNVEQKTQPQTQPQSQQEDNHHIIPKMGNMLSQMKHKLNIVSAKIKTDYELANDMNIISELIDDLNNNIIRAKQILGPDSKYISRLEKRYIQIMGLYQMKYAEVEHKSDLLYQSDQFINDLKEDISDLDYRLGAVMSSAVSNVDTRMKAFNEMGIKIQTFQKVMKLIDDTYTNIQQACQDIQESVEKDLYDIIGNSFDDKQHQDTMGMLGNVAHACDYILKAFDDIGQEMDGVAQFVHPDREMCEQLQLELIAMYENQEKQQKKDERTGGGIDLNDSENEHKDIVSSLPMRTHPNIKPGDSHDDIIIGSRRKSILDFHQAFEQEKKRLSINKGAKGDNLSKLQKEDLKRNKNSRRRRSSVSNLPLGLLPPVKDFDSEECSRSALAYSDMKEKMPEEDKTYLKSLAKSLSTVNVSRLKETPANSPLNSPTNNAPSPRSDEDIKINLNALNPDQDIDDIVDDADIHIPLNINQNGGVLDEREIIQLKKQISDKQQLITDLQTTLRELSENRRRELLHFQQQLENMKLRCREWYEQLMARVGEMESVYENKINLEIRSKHQELERILSEEKLKMNIGGGNMHDSREEIDELSREIARLNEELEKFKGKYFDGEQQKIELTDSLDEIKEEKFKMEEKLEELANEIARYKLIISENDNERDNMNQNMNDMNKTNHNRKSTADWNDLVQKLREEKEQQEAQYEEEFREFERMANEKVVQLEEYYVQQLQMKEVHVQQLQQQLQQQLLLKQQQVQQQQQIQPQTQQIQGNNSEILNEEIKSLGDKILLLQTENNKLQTELNNIKYKSSHDKEQLLILNKKCENNDNKIQAYNASFIELAEKLKLLNDDVKLLRKENNKKEKKVIKYEKKNKKLKSQIKNLNEKIDNIRIVTKELVRLKQDTKVKQEQWEREKIKYNSEINNSQKQMMEIAKKKIDTINKYNVEMNNLRTNIKTLQRRLVKQELENDKLRETDSQSVIGSAANWVPSVFWRTKK